MEWVQFLNLVFQSYALGTVSTTCQLLYISKFLLLFSGLIISFNESSHSRRKWCIKCSHANNLISSNSIRVLMISKIKKELLNLIGNIYVVCQALEYFFLSPDLISGIMFCIVIVTKHCNLSFLIKKLSAPPVSERKRPIDLLICGVSSNSEQRQSQEKHWTST